MSDSKMEVHDNNLQKNPALGFNISSLMPPIQQVPSYFFSNISVLPPEIRPSLYKQSDNVSPLSSPNPTVPNEMLPRESQGSVISLESIPILPKPIFWTSEQEINALKRKLAEEREEEVPEEALPRDFPAVKRKKRIDANAVVQTWRADENFRKVLCGQESFLAGKIVTTAQVFEFISDYFEQIPRIIIEIVNSNPSIFSEINTLAEDELDKFLRKLSRSRSEIFDKVILYVDDRVLIKLKELLKEKDTITHVRAVNEQLRKLDEKNQNNNYTNSTEEVFIKALYDVCSSSISDKDFLKYLSEHSYSAKTLEYFLKFFCDSYKPHSLLSNRKKIIIKYLANIAVPSEEKPTKKEAVPSSMKENRDFWRSFQPSSEKMTSRSSFFNFLPFILGQNAISDSEEDSDSQEKACTETKKLT